jgi:hypothetical protein
MLRKIIIFVGYLGLALFVVGATFALVAYGNDYTYDFSTHKIIQEGHIILDSVPSGIKVTADGKLLSKKTPYQAAYRVGFHTYALSKPGYYSWAKTAQIIAGEVTYVGYAILVPKQQVVTTLDSRVQIIAQNISNDHRHLAYITGGDKSAVYTMDLGNPKPVRVYTPAVANGTTPAEVLTGVVWSADASHLLVSSEIGGKPTYRLMASDGSSPTNLTQQYGFDFTGLQFSAYDWKQLYWVSQGGLRKLDVGAQSVSDVLADNVTQFWPVSGRTLYVQEVNTERSMWSVDQNGNHQQLIDVLPETGTYQVAYANYDGEDELAVVPSATATGTLYSGVFSNTPVAKVLAKNVSDVSFSPDAHFVAFSSPTSIVTYDIEQSSVFRKLVLYSFGGQPPMVGGLTWFDSYHLLANRGGTLRWSEYDGDNALTIGPLYGGFPAYHSSDFKSIIAFRPSKLGVDIVSIRIEK